VVRKNKASVLPFAVWNDLALRTTEMLFASAQVIGHRTRRMAQAGHNPGLRDRREFARMGLEKVEAAGESALAMGQHLTVTNAQLGLRAWQDLCKAGTAWAVLAGSRTLPEVIERQASLMRSVSQSAASASQLSQASAHLTKRALHPVHSRATANAKRLGRHK
jgi:hypothetical protein